MSEQQLVDCDHEDYEIVSDPEKRGIYGQYGECALKEGIGGSGGNDPFDIFQPYIGGRFRGTKGTISCFASYFVCNSIINSIMSIAGNINNLEVGIPTLIEDGIKLLVYAGEYDLICNWLGHEDFTKAPTKPFLVDDKEAVLLTSYGPLCFLKVHDAGHMVPMDQPKAVLEMLKRWTQGSNLDDSSEMLETVTKSSGKSFLV